MYLTDWLFTSAHVLDWWDGAGGDTKQLMKEGLRRNKQQSQICKMKKCAIITKRHSQSGCFVPMWEKTACKVV